MNSPQTLILLDIDHTLFDATEYRKRVFSELIEYLLPHQSENGIEIAENIYKNLREKGYFKISLFLSELSESLGIKTDEDLSYFFFSKESIKKALFIDVLPTLTTLSSNKDITLGIFSGGQEDMQRKKIEAIKHLLEDKHIHINEVNKFDDIPELAQKYKDKRLIVVDDIPEILDIFKKNNENVITVYIDRHQRNEKSALKPDYHIDNLENLITISE